MGIKEFRVVENSEQHKFISSQLDIVGYTGGYGNGKTAALCVDALTVATSYEEARVLVGRATRPKLDDSTKPELKKWIAEDWVERWDSDRNPNIVLKNGTRIEFRHIRQEGKGKGEEQSNLLSATYDAIYVDQLDDPEFGYKDFADLIGRLRGTARYTGDNPNMPPVGPQRFRFTANPTRNWLFRELVNPFFVYRKTGIVNEKLKPFFLDGKCIVEVFNAPTSANERNTGKRYAQRMNAAFRGSMNKRYIQGDWAAYEGLVYPDFDETVHMVQREEMERFIRNAIIKGEVGILEAYDYGQAVPSCYGLAFVDSRGDIFLVDGFYQANYLIKDQATRIKEIRNDWGIVPTDPIFADPQLFKSKNATRDKVGETVAQLFGNEGIDFQRGANAIEAGIAKVASYLQVDARHLHPIKQTFGSPRFHISSHLDWFANEAVDYYWNKNITGLNVDKPRDVNDHAMDMAKYLLTKRGKVMGMVRPSLRDRLPPAFLQWHEVEQQQNQGLAPRHRSY